MLRVWSGNSVCVCGGGCPPLCMEVWSVTADWGISRQGCVRSCRHLDERECSKGVARVLVRMQSLPSECGLGLQNLS